MAKAVAIDFGASSARYGLGEWKDGRLDFRIVRQIAHQAIETDANTVWDIDALVAFCREAADFAAAEGAATVGIDTWGVDLGFLNADGHLIGPPVCYRDDSHELAFEELAPHRARLYELTGCQHQPFNTICQLAARGRQCPDLRDAEWLLLPDLLGCLLGGGKHCDLTHASTTQLLGLDGRWCPEAFDLVGWPVPQRQPSLPGSLGGEVAPGVRLAHVGGHDTASAVAGFGSLAKGTAFANIGTWTLVGVVVDQPIASKAAATANLTNERTADGRVRLLKNVPGFYVVNRVFDELAPAQSVVEWLSNATPTTARIDLQHPDLFNPDSMSATCASLCSQPPQSSGEWAGLLLGSLADAIAAGLREVAEVTGQPLDRVIVGGGGSQSPALRAAIETASGLKVVQGPAEATVVGNLAVQFLAQGVFSSYQQMLEAITGSE